MPAVVGTTSSSDMRLQVDVAGKMGLVLFVIFVDASVISCNENVAEPDIFLSTE